MKTVAQPKTTSKDLLVCRLLEIFYILSFFAFTYQYNINILYALLLFVFIPRQRNKPILICALAILSLLVVLYFIVHDGRAAYRIVKTLAAFRMPFFFIVSGLLFSISKYPTFISFLKRRWLTLVRPYFIFSLTLMLGIWILHPDS